MNKKLLRGALVSPICISIASINASEINISKTQDNCLKQYGKTVEKIVLVNTLDEIRSDLKKEINKGGEDYSGVLTIIDIDNTVTIRNKNVLFSSGHEQKLTGIINILNTKCSQIDGDYEDFEKIVLKTESEELTEQGWGEYVKHIQERGGSVIFETAIKNIEINGEMLADIRAEKLRKLGVQTKSFSDVPSMWLGEPGESPYWSNQGILTSFRIIHNEDTVKKGFNKGAALDAFFEKLDKYHPTNEFYTIIMIDDWDGHIIEMSNCIRSSNLLLPQGAKRNFLGYIFTGVDSKDNKSCPYKFSYKRAYFQVWKLITEKRLYTDAEAELAMQNEKYTLPDDVKKSLDELKSEIKKEQPEKEQKTKK